VAVQWTGLSPGLFVPVDRTTGESLRTQLERGLRDAIRTGRLGPGERLPSTRELSRGLGVSRGLVVECFDQLLAEGYLVSRVGSATRVSPTVQGPTPVQRDREPPGGTASLDVDFLPAIPDLGSFPRTDWAKSMAEVCREAAKTAFDYGDGQGAERLRTVLASYLGRVRGAAASAERIVVCAGFSQGLNLSLTALAARGVSRVAFEDPGYDETSRLAAEYAGVEEVVRVPVDEHGVRVDALASTGVRAVVLTPAHQWPTGVVLSPQRRLALVSWAAHSGSWIVEDDYDAEFRYDREPVGMLQGLAPERVVNIGTVSKSLAPTIRLGWMLCPAELVEPVAALKRAADRGSPGLEQLVLARLMESGRFDRHLRRMRKAYAAKRAALVDTLTLCAPSVEISGLAAGFHAIASLPGHLNELTVINRARERGVGLYGISANRSTHAVDPPQLVLGYGDLSVHAIRDGVRRVADLLR
jgi:GntR family transcriptional regulator/MocR family aminotransferase